MTKKIRNTLLAGIGALLLVAAAALLHASSVGRVSKVCEGLKVEYADKYRFVTQDDVKSYIEEYYGSYIGQRLDSVDLARIEKIIDDQSAVLKSQAYTTDDGFLNVKLTQREPYLRFQKGNDCGFYVDERGYIFPLQDNFTSHVPIIDGAIPVTYSQGYKGKAVTPEEEEWIDGIITMTGMISRNKIWRDGIVQIHVRDNGDLVLLPREGWERFIIGGSDRMDEKLALIGKYYEYIKPARDSAYYSTVNVKFKDQIICRK